MSVSRRARDVLIASLEKFGLRLSDSNLAEKAFLGGIVGIIVLLTVVPLVFLVWTSVWSGYPGEFDAAFTLSHYAAVYLEGSFDVIGLFGNSLLVALGMTLTGMVLGFGAAWLFVRTNLPTKGEMELVLLSCQAIPGYVYAIMYVMTYGSKNGLVTTTVQRLFGVGTLPIDIFSPAGIGFIAGINVVPTVYLLLVPALQDMDPALEEVGRIHGAGLWTTLRSVTLPLTKPALLSATIVMVLYGLGEFAIVSILGVRRGFDVFSTAIHEAVRNKFPPAHGEAAALAVSLLLVMFVLVWYYRRVTARKEAYMTLSGSRSEPQPWDLGAWRWPLALGIWALLLVVWVFPILVLVITSVHTTWTGQIQLTQLTLSHWITPIVDPQLRQSFLNSIVVAVSGATLGTFLVVGTAYYTERTNAPFRGVVDFLSLTPLAVPGIILGSSLLFTFLWAGAITGVLNLYGTLAIIVIGCVMVYLPVSSRIAVGNIVQIHEELEEAARISGASWLDQMREIFLPLFKNTTVVLWFFLALHIVQLLSVPLMTYTADTVVLPVKLYQLYMFQPDLSLVAAISSHFIVLTIALLLGLRMLGITFYDLDYAE